MLNKVVFSPLETGACPQCALFSDCHILKALKKAAQSSVYPKYDDTLEIVVYRCPEFRESE